MEDIYNLVKLERNIDVLIKDKERIDQYIYDEIKRLRNNADKAPEEIIDDRFFDIRSSISYRIVVLEGIVEELKEDIEFLLNFELSSIKLKRYVSMSYCNIYMQKFKQYLRNENEIYPKLYKKRAGYFLSKRKSLGNYDREFYFTMAEFEI